MKKIVLFPVLLIFFSCRQRNFNSSVKEFKPIQTTGDSTPELKLILNELESKVPGLKSTDYLTDRSRFEAARSRADTNSLLDIKFPDLSKDKCEAIKLAYGNVSKLICQSKNTYALQDFLFPAIQATINNVFVPEIKNLPPKKFQETGPIAEALQNNCWSTTLEVQRRANDSYFLFQMNSKEAKRILHSDTSLSELVAGDGDNVTAEADLREQLSKSRFGDIIMIYTVNDLSKEGGLPAHDLLHAATIIDSGGLAFEKTGWDQKWSHRFVTFDDIISAYPPVNIAWEIRRIKKPFDKPGNIIKDWSYYGVQANQPPLFHCAKFQFSYDPMGKASFPADAFKPLSGTPFMSPTCK